MNHQDEQLKQEIEKIKVLKALAEEEEFRKQTASNQSAPPCTEVFSSGATSTTTKPRYDLIPVIAMELLAERFAYGVICHGEKNYRKGAHDREFVTDRVNHLIEHVMKYAALRSRTDLAAILCNAAMLADLGAYNSSNLEGTAPPKPKSLTDTLGAETFGAQVTREAAQASREEKGL